MSKLSRRSLVTTVAALPALAVPAVPAGAYPADDKLVELAAEAFKLWDQLNAVLDEAAESAIHDRFSNVLDVIKTLRAQSFRGLVAKARVADLMHRTDGEVNSEGPHDAWMVVDDLLAMGVQS
jgi:hypothetical protein